MTIATFVALIEAAVSVRYMLLVGFTLSDLAGAKTEIYHVYISPLLGCEVLGSN